MSREIILKVENVSKQYRLGLFGTGTISHDLNRWWAKLRGKEDPYLKIGETNDRATKGESDYVWALNNISFEVKRGEVLGIIGKNGAGKSTLLKILSQVTGPTTGSIKSKGRIASLLEVGTGFHPEMTGKENIYLNGAILGMTKKEISSKLEKIISFSGCERYIDTPVKRYSSGMKVRLAFAVAAHLEPDILVVDEVLAVGDVEFQKKAIGKMQDISNSDGRTVLFVSHDMGAINNLCSRLIVLDNGECSFNGNTQQGIEYYIKDNLSEKKKKYLIKNIELKSLIMQKNNTSVNIVPAFESVDFFLEFKFLKKIPPIVTIELIFKDRFGQVLSVVSSYLNGVILQPKTNKMKIKLELQNGFSFKESDYVIDVMIKDNDYHTFKDVKKITIINSEYSGYKIPLEPAHGKIYTPNSICIIE